MNNFRNLTDKWYHQKGIYLIFMRGSSPASLKVASTVIPPSTTWSPNPCNQNPDQLWKILFIFYFHGDHDDRAKEEVNNDEILRDFRPQIYSARKNGINLLRISLKMLKYQAISLTWHFCRHILPPHPPLPSPILCLDHCHAWLEVTRWTPGGGGYLCEVYACPLGSLCVCRAYHLLLVSRLNYS